MPRSRLVCEPAGVYRLFEEHFERDVWEYEERYGRGSGRSATQKIRSAARILGRGRLAVRMARAWTVCEI